jgi:uncharacterized cysteine cluster protein YcgN (CxxCxxCC family)
MQCKRDGLASKPTGKAPFWQRKTLREMTRREWESLCDGCGLCCMLKIEDEDTGHIYLTRVACKLLDIGHCRCQDYPRRHDSVPDCLKFDPDMVEALKWLPKTCAYRLVSEGKELAWWHPLVSGDRSTVHQAGVSVRDWAVPETDKRVDELFLYIVSEDDDET